jgi:hypothetical protein
MAKKITDKRKTPATTGVNESNVNTTIRIVPKKCKTSKSQQTLTQSAFRPTPLGDKSATVFPTLSMGTLKSTSDILTSRNYIIAHNLTKEYPKKVKFTHFKYPHLIRRAKDCEADRGDYYEEEIAKVLETPDDLKTPDPLSEEQKAIDSFESSIRRTRRELADIIECNTFDKWATFTFDPKKHPQCNERDYAKKKVIQFFNSQQRLHGSFNYVILMETQKNGNYHAHALLGGFTGKFHATIIKGVGVAKRQCYKIDAWETSNGLTDMEDIIDKTKVANYVGKYIQKELLNSSLIVKGAKRYYASRGLARPPKKYNESQDQFDGLEVIDHYENDYVEETTYKKCDIV